MRKGMCQMILFLLLFQCNVNAQIVLSRSHLYPCPREVTTELVKPSGMNTPFGAIDIVCRNWWMMAGLLGKVGDLDRMINSACSRCLTDHRRAGIFHFPVALKRFSWKACLAHIVLYLTLKNSPSTELYGLQGLPLTYFFGVVSL